MADHAAEVVLRFIDFFDWDQIGFHDFEYYLAFIESFTGRPELVGRELLIRVAYSKVVLDM
jgi:hypothetical protein